MKNEHNDHLGPVAEDPARGWIDASVFDAVGDLDPSEILVIDCPACYVSTRYIGPETCCPNCAMELEIYADTVYSADAMIEILQVLEDLV